MSMSSTTPPPIASPAAGVTPAVDSPTARKSALAALRGLAPFLAPYKKQFLLAGLALLVQLVPRWPCPMRSSR